MYKFILGLMIFGLLARPLLAQTDSLDLLMAEADKPALSLLPDHMMPTQSLMWGRKGLLRLTGIVPLTEQNRQMELRLRRKMLVAHQVLGYVTLGAMIAQGIVGAKLFNGDKGLRPAHEALAAATNLCYFTTAGLSLLSPPPIMSRHTKGLNSIKAHKALAYLHLSGMILTNVIAPDRKEASLRALHRASAYTAFGAYFGAMMVMTF